MIRKLMKHQTNVNFKETQELKTRKMMEQNCFLHIPEVSSHHNYLTGR